MGQFAVLSTRLEAQKAQQVRVLLEKMCPGVEFSYHETARLSVFGRMPQADGNGFVVVAAAGTSDLPVAEEAALLSKLSSVWKASAAPPLAPLLSSTSLPDMTE